MNLTLAQGPFLVLSDLHLGHQSAEVRQVEQLAPLFRAGETVIFNGDTLEMRRESDRTRAAEDFAALTQLLAAHGAAGIFIAGNHDPVISAINHLEIPEAGILITHGDILFPNVAPWSKNVHRYAAACAAELAQLPAEQQTELIARLAALRRATKAYDVRHLPAKNGWLGSFLHLLETSWPPWLPLTILKSWWQIPGLADHLMAEHRPAARFFLMGHSHFAGCWTRGPRTIINTGAVMRGFPRQAVRLEAGALSICRLDQRGGSFSMGKTMRRFSL